MRFWNLVLFVARAANVSCVISIDESRSPAASSIPRRQFHRSDPRNPSDRNNISTAPSNPSKTSAPKNLSTLRSAFSLRRIWYRNTTHSCYLMLCHASVPAIKGDFFLRSIAATLSTRSIYICIYVMFSFN